MLLVMTLSTPPAFMLPLNFVKSRTWFTVSTSDVPHAWTVCRNEVWLWLNDVSESNSAAARIYAQPSEERCASKERQALPHAKEYEAREIYFWEKLVMSPMKAKHTPNLDINKLLAWSANIILLLRTAERMMTPKLSQWWLRWNSGNLPIARR